MSLGHNLRNKHYLKNTSTNIKYIGNGYLNEFKLEPTNQLTYSFGIKKNDKYIFQKKNPISPKNKIKTEIIKEENYLLNNKELKDNFQKREIKNKFSNE